MGKPYALELSRLSDTYGWAVGSVDECLNSAIDQAKNLPVIAVASGGALASAYSFCHFHRLVSNKLAIPTTPLELPAVLPKDKEVSVWLISASGRNNDILRALEIAIAREARQIVVICGNMRSPLVALAKDFPRVSIIELAVPGRRDGFLATNSLLGLVVRIANTYSAQSQFQDALPSSLNDLLQIRGSAAGILREYADLTDKLWTRGTTLLLHGNIDHAAAVDLESRFAEAAINNLQIINYRNFGHGRHNWLTARGRDTGIIAFIADDTADIAKKTIQLIPPQVEIVRLDCRPGNFTGHVKAIVNSIFTAGAAGFDKNLDPGRPKVPMYGRKLYHLRPPRDQEPNAGKLLSIPSENTLLARKLGKFSFQERKFNDLISSERQLWSRFLTKLTNARFRAILLDYDGTLVESRSRFEPPKLELFDELNRLLSYGIVIGVATGRGTSVLEALRSGIQRAYWPRVLIGYLNGATIMDMRRKPVLGDIPKRGTPLNQLLKALDKLDYIKAVASIRAYRSQISIRANNSVTAEDLYAAIAGLIVSENIPNIRLTRSAHSLDAFSVKTSKLAVAKALKRKLTTNSENILAIGDSGQWPGNDFDLLTLPISLSVDQCSPTTFGGWNLTPIGAKGTLGTQAYLSALTPVRQTRSRALKMNLTGLVSYE